MRVHTIISLCVYITPCCVYISHLVVCILYIATFICVDSVKQDVCFLCTVQASSKPSRDKLRSNVVRVFNEKYSKNVLPLQLSDM